MKLLLRFITIIAILALGQCPLGLAEPGWAELAPSDRQLRDALHPGPHQTDRCEACSTPGTVREPAWRNSRGNRLGNSSGTSSGGKTREPARGTVLEPAREPAWGNSSGNSLGNSSGNSSVKGMEGGTARETAWGTDREPALREELCLEIRPDWLAAALVGYSWLVPAGWLARWPAGALAIDAWLAPAGRLVGKLIGTRFFLRVSCPALWLAGALAGRRAAWINVWVHISGLRVQNSWLRLRVQGSGLCAQGLCSRIISKAKESDLNAQMVQGSGFRAQGSRFRVQGSMSGFRVQGSGVRANAQESGSNIMNQSSTLSAQLSALSVHC